MKQKTTIIRVYIQDKEILKTSPNSTIAHGRTEELKEVARAYIRWMIMAFPDSWGKYMLVGITKKGGSEIQLGAVIDPR